MLQPSQVPLMRVFSLEATKTNVFGTNNVLDLAIQNEVEKVIVLSTDKAVYPINAMGISKSDDGKSCDLKIPRIHSDYNLYYAIRNVMASRGSVIPLLWIK